MQLVALYNRTVAKAEAAAAKYNVAHVYGDAEDLFRNEELDFVDIITEVPAHAPLVELAAKYKVPVICQKPMASDYATCEAMVAACREAGVPFLIHENFRWQAAGIFPESTRFREDTGDNCLTHTRSYGSTITTHQWKKRKGPPARIKPS